MIIEEIDIKLRDGRSAIFRSPVETDGEEMLDFIIKASGETDYLRTYPEEFERFTIEEEKAFLIHSNEDPNGVMIACIVDGKIAGNCQITFHTGMKEGHRAAVAIALLKEFWGFGIGTRMFEEMFRIARDRVGVRQIELDFIEGNKRARSLYEKMGFRITGIKRDAIRLKDGSFVDEYMMIKWL